MSTAAPTSWSRPMFVDGAWKPSASGKTYEVPNPATEESIGSAPEASVEDMRAAIGAARKAFDEGPWPRSSTADRARVLLRIADEIERRKEDFRQLLIAEAAATYVTHDIQLEQPIAMLRHYAELVHGFPFEEPLPARVTEGPLGAQLNSTTVYRHPVGVCAMIPTWNFPLFVAAQKLGPALATGCTMVFKPSPYGPLVNLLLADAVAAADLPPGVVNFVTGQSNEIAEAMVTDPRVDKISFTGSVQTGKRIMEAAARNLTRVHLELGGKSVGIFLDSDNLDMMAPRAAAPAFFHAGQGCAMQTRVLVPRDSHDALVDKMVAFVTGMAQPGDPTNPATLLGPVIREERRAKIEEYIASGVKEGARLACGGGRPKHLPHGYFLEPTIFANVPNHIRIAQEEIFGPVVAVIPFGSIDEAVQIANDSSYGLAGAVYSSDRAKAIGLAKRIRTGVVWVNNGINLADAPFGGFKQSGIGREGGRFGMEEYCEIQQVTWT